MTMARTTITARRGAAPALAALLAAAVLAAGLSASEGAPSRDDPITLVSLATVADDETLVLNGTVAVDAFQVGGSTYLVAAAAHEDGIQIINVTDPDRPAPVASLADGRLGAALGGAYGIASFMVDGRSYAAVAAVSEDAVQIINVTDPARPVPVARLADDAGTALDGASAVAAFEADGRPHLAVASYREGVQLVDVTDPARPVPTAGILDDDTTLLGGARGLAAFRPDGPSTYLAVAARGEDGIQIINVTDPDRPAPVASLADGRLGAALGGARDLAAFRTDDSTYLAVAAHAGNATQIINVTRPAVPVPVSSVTDGPTALLAGAAAVAAGTVGDSFTYVLAVSMFEEGVQVVDVTHPAVPVPANHPGGDSPSVNGTVRDVALFEINGTSYAAVADGFFNNRVKIFEVVPAGRLLPPAYAASLVPVSAAYLPGGLLEVAFSEPLNGTLHAGRLVLRDAGPPGPRVVALSGAPQGAATAATVRIPLDRDQAGTLLNMTDPRLDVGAGAVFDARHLPIPATAGHLVEIPDVVPPEVASAAYHGSTGLLAIAFSEPLNHTATDYGLLAVLGQSANLTLAAVPERAAPGPDAIHATLGRDQRQALGVPLSLLVSAGAVADRPGNPVEPATVPIRQSGNGPPTVNAGPDRSLREGSSLALNAAATDPDGDPLAYLWTHDSNLAIALANSTSPSTTVTAPLVDQNATLALTITVTDPHNATASDGVVVTVLDGAAPPAKPQNLRAATVNSTAITVAWDDPADPAITGYTILSGIPATRQDLSEIVGDTGSNRTGHAVGGLRPDTAYVFRVAALSGNGPSERSDPLRVATAPANSPPTVDAGADRTVGQGTTVLLNGTASDQDGDALTYLWSHDSVLNITLANSTAQVTQFVAPQVGSNTTVTFTLTADDGTEAASDSTVITITAIITDEPALDPRGLGAITLISSQPGTVGASWDAPDEAPRDYRISWARVGQPYLTWTDPSGNAFPTDPSHTITGLEEGEAYKVKARARYDGSAPGPWSGEFTITVASAAPANHPPTANAGPDRTITEGQTITLSGTASDPDQGDLLTYLWTHDSNLAIAFGDAASLSTTVTAPLVDQDATAVLTITVTDPHNVTTTDTITLTITAIPEQDPRELGGITLSSTVPGVVEVAWDAPTEAPRDYRISWARVGQPYLTWTDPSGNAFPTDPSHTITDLEEGETYKVKARARYDGSAPGPWSGEFTITVASAAPANSQPDSDPAPAQTGTPDTNSTDTDTTSQVITLAGKGIITLKAGDAFSDPGATCADETDGALPVTGSYTVPYTCTDAAGNRASEARNVTVEPAAADLPPVITAPGPTCTDHEDGDLPVTVHASQLDTTIPGEQYVYYRCDDSAGNTTIEYGVVTVVEP